ncbi:hypothetical protein BOX37_11235 [Nocardia mangyaensis]|uniref:Uncharacterized protein n=1 Tax=Nocardia mangyaensis TaxID=2213200 RepID=A0A1J0VQX3_9NOCA|nr:hypothetical protein [Nocardia mangyaensis]APE34436.1 hypothetical protein BOX37_11235 [Nocardia mangyaensis]
MQTQGHAAGPTPPAIEPVAPGADECRRLRIVAQIDDPHAWDLTAARLLASGRRRWRARPDIADHPALLRWTRIQQSQEIPVQPCLRTTFAAVAAGRAIGDGDPCTGFAAAIMLLSSCPTEAILQSDTPNDPRVVRFSVYAYREDDLPLAEDLITTTIRTCGTVLVRRCTVLRRRPATPATPLLGQPVPELFVLGSTAAR